MPSRYAVVYIHRDGEPLGDTVYLKIDADADGIYAEPLEALHNAAKMIPSLSDDLHGAEIKGWTWIRHYQTSTPLYYVGTGSGPEGVKE